MFDDSITGIEQDDQGVHVTFKRAQPRTFDFVVGADGLRSNVRALTFGSESQFLHHLGYQAAFFTTQNYMNLNYEGLYYNEPGKVAGMYTARQNTEVKAFFAYKSPALELACQDRTQQQQSLADTYADVGWELPRLLELMEESTDFYFDSVSQVQLEQWSNGRVVLLGDAAYCASIFSGLGTGLAMVGGYVLAGELATAKGDYRAAFTDYQEQMTGYAAQCAEQANGVGEWLIPPTWEQISARNHELRAPSEPFDDKPDIASAGRQAASAIKLKDYVI
jgi:2-polyprenyl-6-methoxyphenol hydroxylase-like FAD-dependent oxidoreductase